MRGKANYKTRKILANGQQLFNNELEAVVCLSIETSGRVDYVGHFIGTAPHPD